jgi:two-component system, probable response regulator PhcQ
MRDCVLFVDDEPELLEGLKLRLRKQPYDILSAASGPEGLEILAKENVRVIVSDERMPDMPGSEFLTICARKYPKTVRILLTGQAGLEASIKAVNDGKIYSYLRKPCEIVDLAITIQSALQQVNVAQEFETLKANVETMKIELLHLLRLSQYQANTLTAIDGQHAGLSVEHAAADEGPRVEYFDLNADAFLHKVSADVNALFEHSGIER